MYETHSRLGRCVPRSLNVNPIADHPDLKLFEFLFPPLLECLHPGTVILLVRHIDDDACEIVAVNDSRVLPAPFDYLCFVADGAEAIADFEDSQ